MEQHLGVAFVGFGDHARRGHAVYAAAHPATRIVAVCDPSPDARRAAADEFGIDPAAAEASLDDVLADPAVHAVCVCGPDAMHAGTLLRAVAAGKHVLVEKPVADRLWDLPLVQRALADAAAAGLVVTSCHPRRFDPPYTALRRAVADLDPDRHGLPVHVALDFSYHEPTKHGLHHGLLIDHVSHEIDLVNWLLGPSPFRARRLHDSEVRYAVAGERDDGVTFCFTGTRALRSYVYAERAEIRTERTLLTLDTHRGLLHLESADDDLPGGLTLEVGTTDYPRRFADLWADFADACLGGTPPYLTPLDLVVNTAVGAALTEHGEYASDGGTPRAASA